MAFRTVLTLLLVSLSSLTWAAQHTPLPASKAFSVSASTAPDHVVRVHFNIAPRYFIYRDRFHFDVVSPHTVKLGRIIKPRGKTKTNKLLGKYQVYYRNVTLPIPILNAKGENRLKIRYQGCSDWGYCYPPMEKIIHVNFALGTMRVTASEPISEQDNVTALLTTHHWLAIMAAFLGFGLLLSFTPCVLPMIPILSSIILGRKHLTAHKAFMLSLVYVLSMAITYALAGVVVSMLGANIQALMQTPWVLVGFALIFVLLAFSLFGFYDIKLPERWQHTLTHFSNRAPGGSYLGVAAMGVLATLIVSPCITPPLIGVLAYLAKTGDAVLGAAALFTMGIGMGVPLLIIGTLGGKYLPKTGRWMEYVKRFFGVLLLLVAVLLVVRVIPHSLFINGKQKTLFTRVDTSAQIKAALQKAKQEQKFVLLDFYADWCLSCQVMEARTFPNKNVQTLLKKMVRLQVDVTEHNAMHQLIMKKFNIVAPPALLFFDQEGKPMPRFRIVGEVSARQLKRHLEKILNTSISN